MHLALKKVTHNFEKERRMKLLKITKLFENHEEVNGKRFQEQNLL